VNRVPWVTIAFVLAGVAIALIPGGAARLEYDRTEVAAGEFWRPFSAQLTHWSARMAVVDLVAVLVLGALLEIRSRRAAALAILCGALLAGAAVHLLPPPVDRYRGASGIASALFVALACALAARDRTPLGLALALSAVAALAGKSALETATGHALFAGPMPPGVDVLPRVHLLGACGGAIGWGLSMMRGRGSG
jgi:rhomboid family GlyGly-CTERM serine protease